MCRNAMLGVKQKKKNVSRTRLFVQRSRFKDRSGLPAQICCTEESQITLTDRPARFEVQVRTTRSNMRLAAFNEHTALLFRLNNPTLLHSNPLNTNSLLVSFNPGHKGFTLS